MISIEVAKKAFFSLSKTVRKTQTQIHETPKTPPEKKMKQLALIEIIAQYGSMHRSEINGQLPIFFVFLGGGWCSRT